MAHVLSTKRARKRVVAAVPIGLLVAWFIYGWTVVLTKPYSRASWYEHASASVAGLMTLLLFIIFVFYICKYLIVLPIARWINKGSGE